MPAGDIGIYTEDTGGDAITTSTKYLGWDTVVREDDIYSTNSPTSNQITVGEAGHYLVIYNINIGQTGIAPASPTRAQDNTALEIDDGGGFAQTDYGRSGCYYRNHANVDEVGGLHGATILDLGEDDILRLGVVRSDTSGTGGDHDRMGNEDGASRFAIIRLNDNWDYLRIRNTADLSQSTSSFQNHTWDTNDEVDAAYSHSTTTNTEQITIEETGVYMVFMNVDFFGNNNLGGRANIEMRMSIDTGGGFNEVDGTRVTCFCRNVSNCRLNMATYKGIHEFDADDIIKFEYRHENATACPQPSAQPLGNLGGNGCLTIVQLPDTAEIFRIREAGGGARVDTDGDYDFDTTDREDTASFDHNFAAADEVEAIESMHALVFCTYYGESTSSRNSSRIQNTFHYFVEGTIAGNAEGDAGHSNNWAYNRGDVSSGDIETAGASQCGILEEVTSADSIVFQNQAPGTGSDSTVTFAANRVAAQGLNIGTIFPEFENADDTVDINEVNNRAVWRSQSDVEDVNEVPNRAVWRSQSDTEDINEVPNRAVWRGIPEVVDIIEGGPNRAVWRSIAEDEELDEVVNRAVWRATDETIDINELAQEILGFVRAVDETVDILDEVQQLLRMVRAQTPRGESALAGADVADSASGIWMRADSGMAGTVIEDGAMGGPQATGDGNG